MSHVRGRMHAIQPYLFPLQLLLRAQTGQQRVQALEVGGHLDFIVQIILNPRAFVRRQAGGHCCCGGKPMRERKVSLCLALGFRAGWTK